MENKYVSAVRYKRGISEKSYLNKLPVIKYLDEAEELTFDSDVTFFVGENGTGKSTIIEAIAVAAGFNAEGGTRNFNFSTKNTVSELSEHITLIKYAYPKDGFFLRAESLYNAATYIDMLNSVPGGAMLNAYGGVSLHEQSHGESFLSLVQNRFGGNGLYILDEPEAALSPSRQLTLLAEIHELVKKNSQFIIATHSPILLSYPEAEILEINGNNIDKVDYNNCEHVRVYRSFLESPERTLKLILD